MFRLFNPAKRERDQAELDAMAAQRRFWGKVWGRLIFVNILIISAMAVFYSGVWIGRLDH